MLTSCSWPMMAREHLQRFTRRRQSSPFVALASIWDRTGASPASFSVSAARRKQSGEPWTKSSPSREHCERPLPNSPPHKASSWHCGTRSMKRWIARPSMKESALASSPAFPARPKLHAGCSAPASPTASTFRRTVSRLTRRAPQSVRRSCPAMCSAPCRTFLRTVSMYAATGGPWGSPSWKRRHPASARSSLLREPCRPVRLTPPSSQRQTFQMMRCIRRPLEEAAATLLSRLSSDAPRTLQTAFG